MKFIEALLEAEKTGDAVTHGRGIDYTFDRDAWDILWRYSSPRSSRHWRACGLARIDAYDLIGNDSWEIVLLEK